MANYVLTNEIFEEVQGTMKTQRALKLEGDKIVIGYVGKKGLKAKALTSYFIILFEREQFKKDNNNKALHEMVKNITLHKEDAMTEGGNPYTKISFTTKGDKTFALMVLEDLAQQYLALYKKANPKDEDK